MHARLRRPSQKFTIRIYRILVTNALVEGMILLKQRMKTSFNDQLMQGIRWLDEGKITILAVITPYTDNGGRYAGPWVER